MVTSIKSSIGLSIGLVILSVAIAGCGLNRSDAKAVSEAFFRAIMTKDNQQLQQVMGSGGSVPSGQTWNGGSFIHDYTKGGEIRELWVKEPIIGYTIGETVVEDYQGLFIRPERLSRVKFVLSGRTFIASFIIKRQQGTEWYPVWNRTQSGDFLITFEEP